MALQQVDEGAAAGRSRRMGGALPQQHSAQPGRLPVRHHPEGDPRGVQGLGRRKCIGAAIAATCAIVTAGIPCR